MSQPNAKEVHQAVQQRYGRLAEESQSCCVGMIYETDLSVLPQEVAEFSLGCGDPISLAELQPGEVVVDLGSGGGIDALLAAQKVGATGYVIGVDMTPAMIERATVARDKAGVTNVDFRLGQIEKMPIDDATADVIISNCVINLAPDKQAVFADAFRVLKPGGRFAVADIVADGELTPEERANFDAWSECVTGAIDMELYLEMLRAVGFKDVEITHKVEVNEQQFSSRIFSARIVAHKPR